MAAEEVGLEGEAEQSPQAELPRLLLEPLVDRVADTGAAPPLLHGEGAHFTEVLPQHVQSAAADDVAAVVVDGDGELLHRLEEHDELLAEQDALLHERLDECVDAAHVGRARLPHAEPQAPQRTLFRHALSLEPSRTHRGRARPEGQTRP